MLIARARPRFIKEKYKYKEIIEVENDEDFYLNSGSKAFYFFLKANNKINNRPSRVGIQSFTCTTMLDAIIQSGSEAYIFDVKKEDISISLNEVKNIKLDILVLTHYQGIPNQEYLDFVEYCKKESILLVDDLAHVSKSIIEGVQIGSLSNVYIESYRFDKPFVAVNGGMLHINSINKNLHMELRSEYKALKAETKKCAEDDIDLLYFLMEYTKPQNLKPDIDYIRFIEHPALRRMWSKKAFVFKIYRDMIKIIGKLNNFTSTINEPELYKINSLKIEFIKWQKEDFFECYKKLIDYDYRSLLELPVNPFDKIGDFVWNRYSLIDESGEIRNKLQRDGIIARNYNWTNTLLDWKLKYPQKKVHYIGKLENAEYFKRNIINIPIWQFDNIRGGGKI